MKTFVEDTTNEIGCISVECDQWFGTVIRSHGVEPAGVLSTDHDFAWDTTSDRIGRLAHLNSIPLLHPKADFIPTSPDEAAHSMSEVLIPMGRSSLFYSTKLPLDFLSVFDIISSD